VPPPKEDFLLWVEGGDEEEKKMKPMPPGLPSVQREGCRPFRPALPGKEIKGARLENALTTSTTGGNVKKKKKGVLTLTKRKAAVSAGPRLLGGEKERLRVLFRRPGKRPPLPAVAGEVRKRSQKGRTATAFLAAYHQKKGAATYLPLKVKKRSPKRRRTVPKKEKNEDR